MSEGGERTVDPRRWTIKVHSDCGLALRFAGHLPGRPTFYCFKHGYVVEAEVSEVEVVEAALLSKGVDRQRENALETIAALGGKGTLADAIALARAALAPTPDGDVGGQDDV